jgi:membrane fusion protein, multidrug efflux system
MDQTTNPKPQAPHPDATPRQDPADNPALKRKSGRGVIWTLLLLVLVVGGIYWWTTNFQPAQAPERGRRGGGPMSIVPQTVAKGDVNINIDALGTVTSLATVVVRTQVSGQLITVAFKEGQEVKKGELLAEIDPRPYEAALAQAKGQLARDEALLKGAQVDLERYKGLAAQNAIPRQTLDTQTALVAQYQGTVASDQAQVRAAEVNLAFTRITAPSDGRIGLRIVDQGNYVTPGDTNGLVVITQLVPISVMFTVPEDNLQAIAKRLREGAKLPVTAFDRGARRKIADGTLETFDSQIDATTGTIKLRSNFTNEQRTLYPNQFVNIRLLVDTHKDAVVMPTAGVQRGVPGTFVYIVNDNNTVSVRKVTLGATEGDKVEVVDGLKPGDKIVVDGADRLRDGAAINVRSEADQNMTPAAPRQRGNGEGRRRREGARGQRETPEDSASPPVSSDQPVPPAQSAPSGQPAAPR